MSELGRLIGTFVSPGEAFRDIVQRPHWWVPLLASVVVITAYVYAISERVGWEEVIRRNLDATAAGRNLSAQQRQAAIQTQLRFLPYFQYGAALVTSLVSLVVVAGVLRFLADVVLGAGIGFKRMMGIAAYGLLPNTLMAGLSMAVLYLVPPDEFDMQNPLMFNAGAFMDPDAPLWLRTLGASFDLFSFWSMLLLAIGMSKASRHLRAGKAFVLLLFPWTLIVTLRVGAAAIFG
jgi:hypothetical protein